MCNRVVIIDILEVFICYEVGICLWKHIKPILKVQFIEITLEVEETMQEQKEYHKGEAY